jgi:hypothetical protein
MPSELQKLAAAVKRANVFQGSELGAHGRGPPRVLETAAANRAAAERRAQALVSPTPLLRIGTPMREIRERQKLTQDKLTPEQLKAQAWGNAYASRPVVAAKALPLRGAERPYSGGGPMTGNLGSKLKGLEGGGLRTALFDALQGKLRQMSAR